MPTATNVTTGKPKVGGAIYKGAITATLPTDATTALTGFTSLGYCSEDGLRNAPTRTVDTVKAWGGDTVLTLQTEFTDTFTFTLIEALNEDVLKTVYGESNVTSATNKITIKSNSKELENIALVAEMVMTGNKACRIVIPNGKVSNVGEITYSDSEAVGYEVTITALPDAQGNTHYTYIA